MESIGSQNNKYQLVNNLLTVSQNIPHNVVYVQKSSQKIVLHLKYLSQFVTVRLNGVNIQYKYSRKTHLGFKHERERER